MKTVEMHRLLEREKRKLNRAIVMSDILRGVAFSGTGTGVILLVIRLFGFHIPFMIQIWGLITLGGAAVGFAIGWRHRLSLRDTACWLDRRLKTDEALSAAFACFDHEIPGPFDAAIIERAERLSSQVPHVKWPFRYLKRWVSLSVESLVLGAILVQISLYLQSPKRVVMLPEAAQAKIHRPSETMPSEKPNITKPQDVAKQLAPKDPKLKQQMEEALRSGNTALLQHLLQTAELQRAGRSLSETEASEQGGKQQFTGFNMPSNKSSGKNEKVNSGNSSNRKNEKRQFGAEKGKQQIKKFRENNKGKKSSEMTNNQKKKTSQDRPMDKSNSDQPQQGRDPADRDPKNHNRYWGELNGDGSGQRIVLKHTKDGPMYEYVLPGKQARVPLSRVVQDSKRAVEVSLDRQGVPGEYQEFVQSYFLTLAREAGGASPNKGKE